MSRTTWIDSVTIEHGTDAEILGLDDYRHLFRRHLVSKVTVVIGTTDPEFVQRIIDRMRGEFEKERARDPRPARAELTDGPPALPPAPARALPPVPIEGVFEDDEP